jgi:hypothetical protein
VNTKEMELLQHLFKDLALRNSAFDYLEKSTFLNFCKLPVSSIQGFLGERLFDMLAEFEEFTIKLEKFTYILEVMCRANESDSISVIFQLIDLENSKLLTVNSFKMLVVLK